MEKKAENKKFFQTCELSITQIPKFKVKKIFQHWDFGTSYYTLICFKIAFSVLCEWIFQGGNAFLGYSNLST